MAAPCASHLNVGQNVALVHSLAGQSGRNTEILSVLGLQDRSTAYPSQLSGGELARAGLAVALANSPTLLLADEPTGEVDSTTEARVLDLLVIVAKQGTAVVVASHSAAIAAAATRVMRLEDGRAC
jgi:putative ABC transport system ATP-binding protein